MHTLDKLTGPSLCVSFKINNNKLLLFILKLKRYVFLELFLSDPSLGKWGSCEIMWFQHGLFFDGRKR